jgi:hypothetical protein
MSTVTIEKLVQGGRGQARQEEQVLLVRGDSLDKSWLTEFCTQYRLPLDQRRMHGNLI